MGNTWWDFHEIVALLEFFLLLGFVVLWNKENLKLLHTMYFFFVGQSLRDRVEQASLS